MSKSDIIKKIIKDINGNRLSAESRAYDVYLRALMDSAFLNADLEYRSAVIELSKAEFLKQNVKEAVARLNTAALKRDNALAALNLSKDDISPSYSCRLCKDTGHVDGKLCPCVQKRYLASLKDGFNPLMRFTFSDCDISKINDEKQREAISALYEKMKLFCEKFPNTKFQNIVLMGPTGSGKTSILSAIGNELVQKGFSVQFLSAFEFNNTMLKYHTAPIDDRGVYMDVVLEPDFLILDDLGTETVLKNVTCEYLLNVICVRIEKGKHTAISSNLSPQGICERYGERLYSKLFNKRFTLPKILKGNDLRNA